MSLPSNICAAHHLSLQSFNSQPECKGIVFQRFCDLDEKMQRISLEAIAKINKATSSQEGTTWERYTPSILERITTLKNPTKSFFVALEKDSVVGYVSFYVHSDHNAHANQFIDNESQAYCALVAVDPAFRGKGIAAGLQKQIFNDDKIQAFKEHIRVTNEASLKVLQKFGAEYSIAQQISGYKIMCCVQKKC